MENADRRGSLDIEATSENVRPGFGRGRRGIIVAGVSSAGSARLLRGARVTTFRCGSPSSAGSVVFSSGTTWQGVLAGCNVRHRLDPMDHQHPRGGRPGHDRGDHDRGDGDRPVTRQVDRKTRQEPRSFCHQHENIAGTTWDKP
jgi:hypothetical protein